MPQSDQNGEILLVGIDTPVLPIRENCHFNNDAPNVPLPVLKWNSDRTALVKVGERDLQKEIDASAKGLTPYEVIRRAQSLGVGVEDLCTGEPIFSSDLDVSGSPETLSDLNDSIHEAEAYKSKVSALVEKDRIAKYEAEKADFEAYKASKKAQTSPVVDENKADRSDSAGKDK